MRSSLQKQKCPFQDEEVPAEILHRSCHNLWGKLPVSGLLALRSLPDKTVRVYTSVCSLIQGQTTRISVAEIAFLSGLRDRQTRKHLKRLQAVGLIASKRSIYGSNLYWLPLPNRSGAPTLPLRSGTSGLPNNDQKEKKPQKPKKRMGEGRESPPKNQEEIDPSEYVSKLKQQTEFACSWSKALAESERECHEELVKTARREAVKEAVGREVPKWWVELMDQVDSRARSFLYMAVPREIHGDTLPIVIDNQPFIAQKLRELLPEIEPIVGRQITLHLDKSPSELSLGEVLDRVIPPEPSNEQVEQLACAKLGVDEPPNLQLYHSVSRYRDKGSLVLELACLAANAGGVEAKLEEWNSYPAAVVLRMIDLYHTKDREGDPVRYPARWCPKTLEGILERHTEGYNLRDTRKRSRDLSSSDSLAPEALKSVVPVAFSWPSENA